jgi:MFS family permease
MSQIAVPTGEGLLDETPPHAGVAPVSRAYRGYVLFVLMLIYVVSFIDRQVINILAEPIKNELHLLDWQVVLLSGFAFGVVYALLGLPIGRLADRSNRVVIISACLAAWSAFTGACGLAQNFIQLVLARAGVGIGEAGCNPASHALIADYYPKEKRASALAFYAMGTPLGSLVGLAMGGVLSGFFGWRVAFMVAAAPGVVMAVLALATIREPRRLIQASAQQTAQAMASFGETFRYLAKKQAFWCLAFAAGIRAFLGYGHAPFTASFFYRVHGPEVAAMAHQFHLRPQAFMGLALGIVGGVAGAFGSWLGGFIADRWGAKDLRVYGAVPAVAVVLGAPVTCFIYLSPSIALAIPLLAVPAVLGTLWYGPVYASAQGMVPQHMRAMSASIMLFVINFLGLVMGALCIGALSDFLNKGLGLGPAEGVRWALVSSTLAGLSSAILFWLARRRIRTDIVS